jgi:glycosyltransferase involved in cell wall biosynthesis
MTAPRIAVVIPCFNHGRYLDEAVSSVLAQTFQDFEIVIVNDGSTDQDTVRLLEAYGRPRTRVLHQENRGLPAARNTGIRATDAPLICALDADDRLAPEWFRKGVAVLDGDPQIAFVSHWVETFGDEQAVWAPEQCDLATLLDRNTVNGAALVRRSAYDDAGGFDESFRAGCEDWDFWITLVERGFHGAIVREVLFYYRRRADSMSRQMLADGVYPDLFHALVQKHRRSYEAHALDLLLRREAEFARLTRECHDLTLEHDTWLEPQVAAHREAIALLGAREQAVRGEQAREAERVGLELALAAARREVAELRASWSWRITGPLRAAFGWFRGEGR